MEQESPSAEYLKGFNDGYIMAQHMGEATEKIAKALGNSDRSQGFKAGREEFELEKQKEKYPSWLKQDRLTSLGKDDLEDRIKNGPEKE